MPRWLAALTACAGVTGCACGPTPYYPPLDAGLEASCDVVEEEEPFCVPLHRLMRNEYAESPSDARLAVGPGGAAQVCTNYRVGTHSFEGAAAIDPSGRITHTQQLEGGVWAQECVWGSASLVFVTNPVEDQPPAITWLDAQTGEELLRIRYREPWPTGKGCRLPYADELLLWEDRLLWLFRFACVESDRPWLMRMHGFSRELGSVREITAPGGIPFDHVVINGWGSRSTLASATDGGVWYLADLDGAAGDPDPRFGLRAVRRAPDGSVAAISPLIVDPDDVGLQMERATMRSYVFAPWAESTADGGYVTHVIGFAPGRSMITSYFARVEPDGTIAWQRRTPEGFIAAGGEGFFSVSIDEQDGGVIAVIHTDFNRHDTYLWGIDRAGEYRWGRDGMRIYPDARDAAGEPARLALLSIASDGAGGAFVARGLRRDEPPFVPSTWFEHFDRMGVAQWAPDGDGLRLPAGCSGGDPDGFPAIDLAADGMGGVWVLSREGVLGGSLQHVDAAGALLFYERRTGCGTVSWPYRTREIVAHPPEAGPDGGSAHDAGPIMLDGGPPADARSDADAAADALMVADSGR